MDQQQDCLRIVRKVVAIFTDLGIPYALGGSLASGLDGVPRFTRDADITVEPFLGMEAKFVARFGPDYFLHQAAIQEAIRKGSSFNIINTNTGFKVDVFIRQDTPFERSAARRCQSLHLPDCPEPLLVHSPEDVVLFKLVWYRLGNEASDQQWQDVLGVLKLQGDRIDSTYLDQWAAELQIADLLSRARQEAAS